jgi:hypothetical protein
MKVELFLTAITGKSSKLDKEKTSATIICSPKIGFQVREI